MALQPLAGTQMMSLSSKAGSWVFAECKGYIGIMEKKMEATFQGKMSIKFPSAVGFVVSECLMGFPNSL